MLYRIIYVGEGDGCGGGGGSGGGGNDDDDDNNDDNNNNNKYCQLPQSVYYLPQLQTGIITGTSLTEEAIILHSTQNRVHGPQTDMIYLFLRSVPVEFDQYVHTFQSQTAAQPGSCIIICTFQLHPSWDVLGNKHSDDRIYRLAN